eukprot:TRINITY_DN2732_c2_g1_i2.p1 TRINITY_DN2732_c2_g1~~TRINITY_DN2732_c2_g1_i2.p1  ORF type:complete len:335 (-),score=56.40 TRINITY_DN2732_c2_g1_i2:154-1080(-)
MCTCVPRFPLQIAREFNFSETTFVFEPTLPNFTKKVRIYTPNVEIPFAGHPNIGTAFALATQGLLDHVEATSLSPTKKTVVFEEKAGAVVIDINEHATADGKSSTRCELLSPQSLSIGKEVPVDVVARTLCLDAADVITTTHLPQEASVGLRFIFVEVRDRQALARARVDLPAFECLQRLNVSEYIHAYVRRRGGTADPSGACVADDMVGDDGTHDGFDIRVRMFAPLDGVPEDPATGSANCALSALITHHHYADQKDCMVAYRIAQGVEMGRPSVLEGRAEKKDGNVVRQWIGGSCVMVATGELLLD